MIKGNTPEFRLSEIFDRGIKLNWFLRDGRHIEIIETAVWYRDFGVQRLQLIEVRLLLRHGVYLMLDSPKT